MKEILNRFTKTPFLILCLAVGIILICFSGIFSESVDEGNNTDVSDLWDYANNLEAKFSRIVEEIDGAENASVMITLDSSFEKVYANNARVEESNSDINSSTDKTTEKQLVLAGSGTSGETPVLLKELCPKVKGVAVIYSGEGNKDVERKIKEAAVSLFGISELKVYVAKGEN